MHGVEQLDGFAILHCTMVGKERCEMNITQLQGRLARLNRELATAYSSLPWNGAWIDRLMRDVAETERAIAAQQMAEPPRVERVAALAR
jgi:hypothetical protein